MILYLFDIDGTLLHAHGSGRAAFDAVFEDRHGLTNASEGVRYGGKTDPQIVDEIFRARLGRGPTSDEVAAFLDAYVPRLRALLAANGVIVIDGVIAALEALAERSDVALGLATGNIRAGAHEKLRAAKLLSWFERDATPSAPGAAPSLAAAPTTTAAIACGASGGVATTPSASGAAPSLAAILSGAIGGFGCDSAVRAELVARAIDRGRERGATGEVIVVGDTIHDISAARACNATVCAVATGADPADKLAHADVVFASLAELPAWHAQRFGS